MKRIFQRTVLASCTMAVGLFARAQQAPGVASPTVAPSSTAAPPPAVRLAAQEKNIDHFSQYSRYQDANAQLPPTEKGRVVFMGDSITDLWDRNGGHFFPGKPFVNRGISGQTTPQMLVRLRQDVIDLHPETVVILAGTNDIAQNQGYETQKMITDNLTSMAELARANHIRVILASVLPAADFPWHKGLDPAPKVKALNAWIADYCKREGLTYLDYYSAMADESGGMKAGLSSDGVHPNAAGYAIMEPLALAAIGTQ